MESHELPLMDVVFFDDTRNLTPSPNGLKLEALATMKQQLRFLRERNVQDQLVKVKRPFR